MKLRLGTLALVATLAAGISTTAFAVDTVARGPNDAEIAHIVVTANTVDIEVGKMAEAKSKNEEVKKFARLMVTDHSAVNKQATDLATKLGVTPQDNDTSKNLKAGGDANMKKLKGLKGAAFDKAYVDNEVAYHEAVASAIEKVLIPNAKNAELKALIVKVAPAFGAHLEHARGLQKSLTK